MNTRHNDMDDVNVCWLICPLLLALIRQIDSVETNVLDNLKVGQIQRKQNFVRQNVLRCHESTIELLDRFLFYFYLLGTF